MKYDDTRLYVINEIMGSYIRIESKNGGKRFETAIGEPFRGVMDSRTKDDMIAETVRAWKTEDRKALALHCQPGKRIRYPVFQRKTIKQFIRSIHNLKPGQMLEVVP